MCPLIISVIYLIVYMANIFMCGYGDVFASKVIGLIGLILSNFNKPHVHTSKCYNTMTLSM